METNELMQFVPDVKFELIPISNLVSNQEYQREIKAGHVRETAENFDLFQVNPVKVSRRDGINYVIDGQHTVEIVAAASGSRETPVWCMVYDNLVYEHEADIFAEQQRFKRKLTPYEIFKASIEAGNEKELLIKDLIESYGLRISDNKHRNCICCVSCVIDIHDRYGYQMLNRVLGLVVATWQGEAYSLSECILSGVARVLYCYGDKIDDDTFKSRLGQVSIKELTRSAREIKAGSLGYASAILNYYNKRARAPLRWDALYATKIPKLPKGRRMIASTAPVKTDKAKQEEPVQMELFEDKSK